MDTDKETIALIPISREEFSMTNPITVLIVDKCEIIGKGICAFLHTQPNFDVVGKTSYGNGAIEIVTRLVPDIVLLSTLTPDLKDIEITLQIKKISPHTQVVIITSCIEDKYSFPVLRAGAISYLLMDTKLDELADALRCAARGEATLHPHVATSVIQFIRGEQNGDNPFSSNLSDRELDVFKLIASGLSNYQIAEKLQIREKTVKGHIGNIRSKLQIADRLHLAIFAWENGIVHPSGDIV